MIEKHYALVFTVGKRPDLSTELAGKLKQVFLILKREGFDLLKPSKYKGNTIYAQVFSGTKKEVGAYYAQLFMSVDQNLDYLESGLSWRLAEWNVSDNKRPTGPHSAHIELNGDLLELDNRLLEILGVI